MTSNLISDPSSTDLPGEVRISSHHVTVLLNQSMKGSLSIKLIAGGKTFSKKYFKSDELTLRWDFKPFFTLQRGSRLVIQFRQRLLLWPESRVRAEGSISFEDARSLLSISNGQCRDHELCDNPKITIDFAPNTSGTLSKMLNTGAEIVDEYRSVLDRLGKSRTFLKKLIDLGTATELHPVVTAVFTSVNAVYNHFENQEQCNKVVLDLARNMASTLGYIEDVEQFAKLVQLKMAIEDIRPLMADATNFIIKCVSHGQSAKAINATVLSDRDLIDDLTRRFEVLKQQFDRGVSIQSAMTLESVLAILTSTHDDTLLSQLKPKDFDRGSPVEECMDGTRQDILATIDEWVADSSAPNILWLRGHPGVGKSAIAASLVERLQALRRLGSNFFFQREKINLTTPTALWRTVASDIASRYPTARKILVAKLNADEINPNTVNVNTLFHHLIQEPLSASTDIPPGRLPVVVVDALDECGGLDGSYSTHRMSLLRTLKSWSGLPSGFKLVITSRGEDDIISALSTIRHQLVDVLSGQMVSAQSSNDIRAFLKERFSVIAIRYSKSLPSDWPGDPIIEELADRAAGLFIWAETVFRFVIRGEPQQRLRQIRQGVISHGDMAALYSRILNISFPDTSAETITAFHSIVGAIILVKTPLSMLSLGRLLSVDNSVMDFICKGLRSVVLTDDTLQFIHQSFVEFLLDPGRCPRPFFIELDIQNRNLAQLCFHAMKSGLRFNICNISSSYFRNDDIPDLTTRITKAISPELSYSCCFFVDHLRKSAYEQVLVEGLWDFMSQRFLYWLELLSLIQQVEVASTMLSSMAAWIKANADEDTAMISDAIRFVAAFASIISQSAPHIYLSALPFAPRESVVSKQYLSRYLQTFSVQTGAVHYWPAIQNVLTGHTNTVSCVALSSDGKRIVSGSWDKTLRVWDAETGDTLSGPFEGHTDWVSSVKFSPDGKRIVSSSKDGTVRVWDAETGDVLFALEGHTKWVGSVALSPDGKRIVSGSEDKTVRVWDSETGKVVLSPFQGHTDVIGSVAFSANGERIVSGSVDKTIRVWDAKTGVLASGPFKGPTHWISSVKFSPNGKYVVAGSWDGSIWVWDADTGSVVSGPFRGHLNWVCTVMFSPDGKRIVSGSGDKTIRVIDAMTGDVVSGPLEGHTQWVNATFSPDGKRIVSGSGDKTIRVWDAEARASISQPFKGHTGGITSVKFSPDGMRIVSGSRDKTICLWDAETGAIVSGPFGGHTKWITSVAFSSDGKHIVSGSEDQTIRVRDGETGSDVSGPFRGHVDGVTSVAFSPDGTHVVSGSVDKTIRVWNVGMGDVLLAPFEGHTDRVTSVAVSPDGKLIVSGSEDKTIRLWDAETGKVVLESFEGHTNGVTSVSFSLNGKYVVSGSWDGKIYVWNVKTGDIVSGPFEGHTNRVTSVVFSPNGELIASGSGDQTIRVWDTEARAVVAGPFKGHTTAVTSIAWSADGKRIVSGSADHTIRVWDVEAQVSGSSTIFVPFKDYSQLSGNGWILGECGELILWVPPLHRPNLFRPSNVCVIGANATRLDLSRFVHGTSWTECCI